MNTKSNFLLLALLTAASAHSTTHTMLHASRVMLHSVKTYCPSRIFSAANAQLTANSFDAANQEQQLLALRAQIVENKREATREHNELLSQVNKANADIAGLKNLIGCAAFYGDKEIAEQLLLAGADPLEQREKRAAKKIESDASAFHGPTIWCKNRKNAERAARKCEHAQEHKDQSINLNHFAE